MTNSLAQLSLILTIALRSFIIPVYSGESKHTNLALTIYSGNCTLYKLTFVPPNKKKYTPVKVAFGKVVIDRAAKKLNFFFDGKLMGSWNNILSYVDNEQGGEGFSMDNGWSAHRFTAEKLFQMYNSSNAGNDMGYQYDMENYKIN